MMSRRALSLPFLSSLRRLQQGGYITRTFTTTCQVASPEEDHIKGVADDEGARYQFTKTNFSDTLWFRGLETEQKFDVYRVMDRDADLLQPSRTPQMEPEVIEKCYHKMVGLSCLDEGLAQAVEAGEVSFSATCTGEEAVIIGTAAGLQDTDTVFSQYREYGVLLWRGWPYERFIDQSMGNTGDPNKGRQMPIHYGCKDARFVTVSSPLATQLPQAVGLAYAQKRAGKQHVTACYLGESTTSAGDAHAGFNFAAVLDTPVIFIVRNNGYAISAPVKEHYRGDGIAARGPGYGLYTVRVDGNDLLAVYEATKKAREIALEKSSPVLIETMSYRVGDHTTAVDGVGYRQDEEVEYWKLHDNPITRVKNYLMLHRGWTQEQDEQLWQTTLHEVKSTIQKCKTKKFPSPEEMFYDVYDEAPKSLNRQLHMFKAHMRRYAGQYPTDKHEEISTWTH